uniref:G protein-coupled receptor kinase interacting ArfGAP 2a n=1 Tax=Cynoglossus semilaevis TaxID=244447 RepID=A0A3P8W1K4_CYNSE
MVTRLCSSILCLCFYTPRWASVNRGILICDECCSVHCSLGRHSLQAPDTHTPWPPTQIQMVQTLYDNGANSIWEHSLLDPASVMSGKRKANPQHKLHIARSRQDPNAVLERLFLVQEVLLTNVCTGNLETCLRLLCLGAQVYFFFRKNDTLHSVVRKPDHKNGQHFHKLFHKWLTDLSELAKAAKRKLQSNNHLFEELAMDVYDKVDRRETDAVWLATQNHSTLVTETTVVPFLPVNPEYSSTQKLARFNTHEFATLVIDILSDAKQRQQGNSVSTSHSTQNVELILKSVGVRHCSESQENDQPDYDSVLYIFFSFTLLLWIHQSLDSDLSNGPITVQEYMEVKNALSASEAKIQHLMKANSNLSDKLRLILGKKTNKQQS